MSREPGPLVKILGWLPMLLMIGVWVYFMRAMQAGRRKAEGQPGSPIGP
jgi:ATP-dependent Zn protease